jgi:hypothetical protein
MGKSKQIDDMAKKREDFQKYLQQLEADLSKEAENAETDLNNLINKFYQDSRYDDAKEILSSKHTDFIQASEFTLTNLEKVVKQIAKVVFSGTSADTVSANVSINSENQTYSKEKVAEYAGIAVQNLESMEVYIAGKVFDIISTLILGTNTTSSITYSKETRSEPLGYGLQLFVSVHSNSFKSSSFFNNEIIYEYLYFCHVKFSEKQAQNEKDMIGAKKGEDEAIFAANRFAESFEKQIDAYLKAIDNLLQQLTAPKDSDEYITPETYEDTKLKYEKLIEESQESLKKLLHPA